MNKGLPIPTFMRRHIWNRVKVISVLKKSSTDWLVCLLPVAPFRVTVGTHIFCPTDTLSMWSSTRELEMLNVPQNLKRKLENNRSVLRGAKYLSRFAFLLL